MAEELLHPVSPHLEASPTGLLADEPPPVMWGLETAFFWEGMEVGRGGAFWQSRHKARSVAELRCIPLLRRHLGRVPPAAGSPGRDSRWDVCPQLRGLACVDVAEQSTLEGRELGAKSGHPGLVVPSSPSCHAGGEGLQPSRSQRGSSQGAFLLLTGSCLPKGRKTTPKHHFELWRDAVAWCSFPHLRWVARTPWGRSHAAQRTVGWTCLPAA